MDATDKVNAIFDDLRQTYEEAVVTYGVDVALSSIAYVAAACVHELEHDERLLKFGPNAPALATGVWTNAFNKFMAALREACAEAQRRPLA